MRLFLVAMDKRATQVQKLGGERQIEKSHFCVADCFILGNASLEVAGVRH
jgi:hypothetical protein